MTVLESILSDSNLAIFNSEQITTACELRSVNERDKLDASSLKGYELVKADLYSQLLLHPDFSEGRLSISYNRDGILKFINDVAQRYEDERLIGTLSTGGGIEDKTDLW